MPTVDLVGRDEELSLADALLRGDPGGVVLAGHVGVGKTRLARELADRRQAAGSVVHRSTATRDGSAVPFGLFSHQFPGMDDGDRATAVSAMVAALRAEAKDGARPLLLVDDAQWADEWSAHALLRIVEARVATVVVTIRSGEPGPASVVALWKDDHLTRIDLQALSATETRTMAEAIVGARLDDTSAGRVWDLSRGNPLFVREVVRSALRTTAPRSGMWVWREPVEPDERLIDVVAAHLRDIDGSARDLLTLLAVGEPLSIGLVRALTSDAALLFGERSETVAIDATTGTVSLAHPIYGDVVRSVEPQTSLSGWRQRLADEVIRRPVPDQVELPEDDPLRQAVWLLDLPPADPAMADLSRQAGERLSLGASRALVLGDYDTAHRLATAARDRLGHDHVATAHLAASTAMCTGRTVEAEAVLDAVASAAAADDVRARAGQNHSFILQWGLDDPDRAIEVLGVWREGLDDAAAGFVDAEIASALAFRGDYAAAHALVDPLVVEADPIARVRAFDTWGLLQVLEGESESVCTVALELAPIALQVSRTLRLASFWAAQSHFLALVTTGRLAEAERLVGLVEMMYPFADDEIRSLMVGSLGFLELTRGHADRAVERLDEAVALGRASRKNWRGALTALTRAEALGLAGRGPEAADALAAAIALVPSNLAYIDPFLGRAEAWVRFANGDLDGAKRVATSASAWCQERGFTGLEIICRQAELRFGVRGASLARLDALTKNRTDPLGSAFGALARGLRAGDGRQLDAAAAEIEGYSLDLMAAEAAAWASEQHRRAGDLTAAAASDGRSRELAARCAGARSPALLARAGDLPGISLTRREQEIVALAANGASNRAVADALHLSVRTVEGHLLRAFAKLGVSDRSELAGRFGPAPAFRSRGGSA